MPTVLEIAERIREGRREPSYPSRQLNMRARASDWVKLGAAAKMAEMPRTTLALELLRAGLDELLSTLELVYEERQLPDRTELVVVDREGAEIYGEDVPCEE